MTEPGYTTVQTQALQENAERLGIVWKRRPATIVAPESDDPTGVTAIMDGDTVAINVYSLIGIPRVGARVMCDIVPPSGIYVVGYIGTPSVVPISNISINRFSPSISTSSTTFSVVAGTSITFRKRYTLSRLIIAIKGSGFASGTALFNGYTGVRINSVDFEITKFFFNTLAEHASYSSEAYIDDFSPYPAGNVLIDMIARTDVAARTFNIDANDLITITVTEVL